MPSAGIPLEQVAVEEKILRITKTDGTRFEAVDAEGVGSSGWNNRVMQGQGCTPI